MKQLFWLTTSILTSLILLQEASAQTDNTKYGSNALISNTTGDNNTAIGTGVLNKNTAGTLNTASGSYALYNNTTGNHNTANGGYALYSNTTGYNNLASGRSALHSNTTGYDNTASGSHALYYNKSGYNNTASGASALYFNTTGHNNMANGRSALYRNTTGHNNTASGKEALYSNTTGYDNTANGTAALYYNATGNHNTATGSYALFANNTGYNNTASGRSSLTSNTTGFDNMASGYRALFRNTTGSHNTAAGNYALYNNSTGSKNTAVGDSAGAVHTYNYSTFLGYKATATVSGLTNVTVIGYAASATASNQVRIGNSSVSSIGGKVGWTTLSDGRLKKNISEDVPGLSFITKLRPVTYTLDIQSIDKASGSIEPIAGEPNSKASAAKEKHTGFIAQEVEKAAHGLNYDFSGVDKPKNDKDLYGLRYAEFVVPLVKAVQELSKENEELKKKVAEIDELRQMVLELKNGRTGSVTSILGSLEQNAPNPVTGTTSIRYHVPPTATSVRLELTNAKGQVVKTVSLNNRGTGQVNLNTQGLSSGTYHYTLYVDSRQADTKRLIVVR
jgi:hypothetical protein